MKIDPDYRLALEYIESMREIYGDDSKFICVVMKPDVLAIRYTIS